MTTDYLDHLAAICGDYGIPKENLVVVDDVAKAAVEFGWESGGMDNDRRRLAKIQHNIEPPIIILKRTIDWDFATDLARHIPCSVDERQRRVAGGLDRRWFLTHLILHEIGHYVLGHHMKTMDDYPDASSEAEVRFLKEREADWWAIGEMERRRNAQTE